MKERYSGTDLGTETLFTVGTPGTGKTSFWAAFGYWLSNYYKEAGGRGYPVSYIGDTDKYINPIIAEMLEGRPTPPTEEGIFKLEFQLDTSIIFRKRYLITLSTLDYPGKMAPHICATLPKISKKRVPQIIFFLKPNDKTVRGEISPYADGGLALQLSILYNLVNMLYSAGYNLRKLPFYIFIPNMDLWEGYSDKIYSIIVEAAAEPLSVLVKSGAVVNIIGISSFGYEPKKISPYWIRMDTGDRYTFKELVRLFILNTVPGGD